VARLRNYLIHIGAWGREKEDALLHECSQQVDQGAADFLAMAPLPLTAMFDHTYEKMPVDLAEQLDDARRRAAGDA
jgi:2-oxoisovalerate dehydrogenase E1 component alpha subunit